MIYQSIKCFNIAECNCAANGSKDKKCDENGKCTCKNNFAGDKCTECAFAHYNFPDCKVQLVSYWK